MGACVPQEGLFAKPRAPAFCARHKVGAALQRGRRMHTLRYEPTRGHDWIYAGYEDDSFTVAARACCS